MVRTLYFLALMLTAIAMGAALAHLFELPNKISIGAEAYLTVQRNYVLAFGAIVLSVLSWRPAQD